MRVKTKFCDVCGAEADGRCRVDTADGPLLGYLCERDADEMSIDLVAEYERKAALNEGRFAR